MIFGFCFLVDLEGPGCSSIGYGAAAELGPLRVGKNGDELHFNDFAWNKGPPFFFLFFFFLIDILIYFNLEIN